MAKWKCEICGNKFDNFHAQGFDNKIYCPLCFFKKENAKLKKQLEDKEDLLDVIQSLTTNIKAHKEREEIIRARLKKCYDFFTKQGLSDNEIIEITRLDCEIRQER